LNEDEWTGIKTKIANDLSKYTTDTSNNLQSFTIKLNNQLIEKQQLISSNEQAATLAIQTNANVLQSALNANADRLISAITGEQTNNNEILLVKLRALGARISTRIKCAEDLMALTEPEFYQSNFIGIIQTEPGNSELCTIMMPECKIKAGDPANDITFNAVLNALNTFSNTSSIFPFYSLSDDFGVPGGSLRNLSDPEKTYAQFLAKFPESYATNLAAFLAANTNNSGVAARIAACALGDMTGDQPPLQLSQLILNPTNGSLRTLGFRALALRHWNFANATNRRTILTNLLQAIGSSVTQNQELWDRVVEAIRSSDRQRLKDLLDDAPGDLLGGDRPYGYSTYQL
jgi:hypothetical protein